MVERSLSIMTMTLWYDTAYRCITYGHSAYEDHRRTKLIVLWAISSTMGGSFIAAGLEQLELDLKKPKYKKTACYGHFGNAARAADPDFTWETPKALKFD